MTDTLSQIYNYRRPTERLATSGQPTEEQLALIAAAGYEVIINLAPHGKPPAPPDERVSVEALGLCYEHIPVEWTEPKSDDLDAFCEVMARQFRRRVWVHCEANFRASAFTLLYRVLKLGWALEEALPDMEAVWEPYGAWPAFIEAELRGRKG